VSVSVENGAKVRRVGVLFAPEGLEGSAQGFVSVWRHVPIVLAVVLRSRPFFGWHERNFRRLFHPSCMPANRLDPQPRTNDDEDDRALNLAACVLVVGFHHQVAHNIFATQGRVLAHIELENRLDGVSIIDADSRELHLRPDKSLEFGW
jgi:hypothetical protein